KDNLLGRGADCIGDLAAGHLHGRSGLPAESVTAAGGVAELGGKKRQHGFQHPWVEGRSGVIIQIDRKRDGWGRIAVTAHVISDSTKASVVYDRTNVRCTCVL